jgi:hypothetical protein
MEPPFLLRPLSRLKNDDGVSLNPKIALGTGRSGKGELKWLETLQDYKVDPETPEPEF